MKNLSKLLMTLGFCALCMTPTKAEAVHVNVFGGVEYGATYYDNTNFTGDATDPFRSASNFQVFLIFGVSEDLYAFITYRNLDMLMGSTTYGTSTGNAGWGGSTYFDGTPRYSLHWNTDLIKLSIGQLHPEKGSYTFGGSALNLTVPLSGIEAKIDLSDSMRLTASYFRPHITTSGLSAAKSTNSELVELSLVVDTPSFKIRPYAEFLYLGPKFGAQEGNNPYYITPGVYGSQPYTGTTSDVTAAQVAYVAGFSGIATPNDALSLSLDVQYGISQTQGDDDSLNRAGFLVGASAGYNLGFGTVTLLGWYGSGDDDDSTNGSERVVIIGTDAPSFATKIAGPLAGDLLLNTCGDITTQDGTVTVQLPGTLGAAIGISGMSFVEKLQHGVWASYTVGTSEISDNQASAIFKVMTKDDAIAQVGLINAYHVNKNLRLVLEGAYGVVLDKDASQFSDNPLMADMRIKYSF